MRTPALTGYSCEDFLKLSYYWEKIKQDQISDLKFWLCLWRRPACQTLSQAFDLSSATAGSKAMGISSATAQVVPDPIKTPTNLSDKTARRCRQLKNCKTKLEKLKNVLNVGHTSTTQYKLFSI